jgi:deoxyinosine 3'endonuclease (endonuclease V)
MENRHGCGKDYGQVVPIRTIAGADSACFGRIEIGVVVLVSYPSPELPGIRLCKMMVRFPYVPGLLSCSATLVLTCFSFSFFLELPFLWDGFLNRT